LGTDGRTTPVSNCISFFRSSTRWRTTRDQPSGKDTNSAVKKARQKTLTLRSVVTPF
jgi:hypothetical protein